MLRSLVRWSPLIATMMIVGCTAIPEAIKLDHYGAFENAEVTFSISGDVDSCSLQLKNYQELYGWLESDTTLALDQGQVEVQRLLTLERPSIVQLMVNGKEREIFLVPSINNDMFIEIDSSGVQVTFRNEDLQNINLYCQQKAMVGGDMHLRTLMTAAVTQSSLFEVADTIDAIQVSLEQLLHNMDQLKPLPTWFTAYEKKRIEYQCLTFKTGAHRVRKHVFGIEDTLLEESQHHAIGFDINDELAMTTPYYLSPLPRFVQEGPDVSDRDDKNPDVVFDLLYRKSEFILSERIRSVYRSYLFLSMLRTSADIPDTLIWKVRKNISSDMEPYLARIDQKYAQFNGLPAPGFHLIDSDGELASLRDFRGNLVLLDFWSVGCRYCKLENPFAAALVEEFQDRNFKLVQIYMHSSREKWEEIKHDFGGIPLYSNENWTKKLRRSYKISGYPRYVLIDEYGIVLEGWCERPSDPALRGRILDYFKDS